MRVVDHRGREANWSFAGCRVLGGETRPRSSYHGRAREVLRSAFPLDVVYEEVLIPGTRLRLDFLIPGRCLAVEAQGEQHFRFVPHMHKTRSEFLRSLARDRQKREFCSANGIGLALLKYSETDDEWRAAVLAAQG